MKLPPVSIRVVLAQETGAPQGEEPLRWLLLTSLETGTLEQAQRVVDLYRQRWDIEIFHRVLKTGCQVERMQIRSCEALLNALALYTVIAWRILYLTHLGRSDPSLQRSSVFEEAEWTSASSASSAVTWAGRAMARRERRRSAWIGKGEGFYLCVGDVLRAGVKGNPSKAQAWIA